MIIDDFLPDFELVRKFTEGVEYGDHEFFGKMYKGIAPVVLPVKALIEEVCGPVSIRLSHLRLGNSKTPLTHYIHADNAGASWAMVLCLSQPDIKTGTAFWTHKETGLDRLPMPCPPDIFNKLDRDLTDLSQWICTEVVETKENRALIFESARFHSRHPEHLTIGETEKPRIVSTTFFDLNKDLHAAPVE